MRGPYTTIWPRNRGFISSEAKGRGRKKSEVKGSYRCIWPEKTPYLQYIFHIMLPDLEYVLVKYLTRNNMQRFNSPMKSERRKLNLPVEENVSQKSFKTSSELGLYL